MEQFEFNIESTLEILEKNGLVNVVYINKGKAKAVRYNNKELLLRDIAKYDGKCNIYLTLNPIVDTLDMESKGGKSISDKEIEKYKFILIDIDPIRKSKTSSTDTEHNEAKIMLDSIKQYLINMGLDGFITANSGNGYHLLLKVDIVNNVDNVHIIKKFLKTLDYKFSNDKVKVDITTANPARLTRFYGTITCKGENTIERKHRRSSIIDIGNNTCSTIEDLKIVINDLSESTNAVNKNYISKPVNKIGITLEEVLTNSGIKISHIKNEEDRKIYVLQTCPFKEHHTDKSAYVIEFNNGYIMAGCHHQSCSENDWNTLKELYNVDYLSINIDKTDEKSKTQEEIILDIVDKLDIYKNSMDEVYVKVNINEQIKHLKVDSYLFKQWISLEYNNTTKKMPSAENISKAINLLKARGMLLEPVIIGQRCIAKDNTIYYDLANSKGEIVKIDTNGWIITTDSECIFDSNTIMKAQVRPVKFNDLNILDKYFRYKDANHLVLQKVALVSSFIDDIQRPISLLHGDKGSAKTSSMKLIRNIVDPSVVPITSLPRSTDDLAVALTNQYLICFDNIDKISNDISDLLCTAVTGGGYAKRKLYTDSEQHVMNFKKCIVLNGINVVATKSDLLDRCILMELDRIPSNERIGEYELDKMIEEDMPKILGAIFTTISKAMNKYKEIELKNLGRLADFTKWGYSIAEVSGIGGETFLNAYLNNQKDSNYEAILSNPVGAAIVKLNRSNSKWEGTPTELLRQLTDIAESENINTSISGWPKAANSLSRRLNEIKSNLKDIGIDIEIVKGVERKIIISKQKQL